MKILICCALMKCPQMQDVSKNIPAYGLGLVKIQVCFIVKHIYFKNDLLKILFLRAIPCMLPDEPVRRVSKQESAGLMFDEFRELAKLFSFQGAYKNIITEMITHMQENSGTPYSSPLLDKALKEQILNDRSEQSSLLKIKRVLKAAINYEYGFIPLDEKDDLFDEKGNLKEVNGAVLPKFDSLLDRTNGLVITVHDTWSTHITLESLEVEGEGFRAKVH